jgi:FixJ family two-component response regulator
MTDSVLVSVIDDDESVREAIPALLSTYGYAARAFDTAEAFLASDVIEATKCVVADVAMPGMSGPELFDTLRERPTSIPVIFITAHIELCENLIALGAIACLHKPFDPMALIEALQRAVPEP